MSKVKTYTKNGKKYIAVSKAKREKAKKAKQNSIQKSINNPFYTISIKDIKEDNVPTFSHIPYTNHRVYTLKDAIPVTAEAMDVEEKHALVNDWIVGNNVDFSPLSFAISAVNSKTRKMVKFGGLYFKNRDDMNRIKRNYHNVAIKFTWPNAKMSLPEVVEADGYLDFNRVPTTKPLKRVTIASSDGYVANVEDAIQEAAFMAWFEKNWHGAPYDPDEPRPMTNGQLFGKCQAVAQSELKRELSRMYGKDAMESAETSDNRRGLKKSGRELRIRASIDEWKKTVCVSDKTADLVTYIDMPKAIEAVENYVASKGKRVAEVWEGMLRGEEYNLIAKRLKINRKTVYRHKKTMAKIWMDYINPPMPEWNYTEVIDTFDRVRIMTHSGPYELLKFNVRYSNKEPKIDYSGGLSKRTNDKPLKYWRIVKNVPFVDSEGRVKRRDVMKSNCYMRMSAEKFVERRIKEMFGVLEKRPDLTVKKRINEMLRIGETSNVIKYMKRNKYNDYMTRSQLQELIDRYFECFK